MTAVVTLELADRPDPRDVEVLRRGLYDYNIARTGISDGRELAIFARDDGGGIVGGVHGWTWGACLDIRELWVAEDRRGRGVGRSLLLTAEREAVARGCRLATLDTHSFQAPGFYQKLGYDVFGVLEDYPRGHRKLFLRKAIG
jgi:GNAT superfamily N-acetyltransferase